MMLVGGDSLPSACRSVTLVVSGVQTTATATATTRPATTGRHRDWGDGQEGASGEHRGYKAST